MWSRCNGIVECPLGDDEKDCVRGPCIEDREFYCASSRKCIPLEWLCDEANDCGDNSDESPHVCTKKIVEGTKF